jgi:integrase
MTDKRMKLTKTSVEDVAPVPGKQIFVWDTEVRGFGLRVSPGGAKTYIMQRRIGSTSRRITIARADDMGAEKARKAAEKLASQFAEGFDPVAEAKRQKAREQTLKEAFDAYILAPTKKGRGKGTPKKAGTVADIRKATRRFEDWLDRPVTEITGAMVRDRHAKIATTSPAQANGVMRYLRAALNHVIADSDEDAPVLKANPVDRLKRLSQWAPVVRATRHLPEDRVADWLDAVQNRLTGLQNDNEVRDALTFLLLTGARVSEALGNRKVGYPALRWADVDLDRGIVVFRNTKNRSDHELPLGRALAAMLRERKQVAGPDFVFSDCAGIVPEALQPAYRRIEAATGIWVTAHDLRRTFATTASRLDISAYKLKRLTNHVSGGDVTDGYVQITTEDLRAAMQRIEDYLLSPARTSGGNIVKMEAAR